MNRQEGVRDEMRRNKTRSGQVEGGGRRGRRGTAKSCYVKKRHLRCH